MSKWVHKKTINTKTVDSLLEKCVETQQFTNYGENVKTLEKFIKTKFEIMDDKSVICVSNATLGIWCLCTAIEIVANRSVKWCTQNFTFPPSAQGFLDSCEIVDIDEYGGLDLNNVSTSCDGIIVTNVFGNVVDIDKYIKWAECNNKFLIFDNAATAYTFYKGKNSCNYGIGSVISFHHTKPFGFGEGGAVIVDKKYENTVRRLINFGIDTSYNIGWDRKGGNYKMSEISAVYILQYLYDNFDGIVSHHISMYNKYKDEYKMYPNFGDVDKTVLSCLCLLDEKFDEVYIKKINDKGIMCRKYYNLLKEGVNGRKIYDSIICYPLNLDIKELYLISK